MVGKRKRRAASVVACVALGVSVIALSASSALAIPMTGMQLWLKADAGVEKAGGLPATLDGDLVQVWQDQSGQNNDAATTGTAPAFKPAAAVPNGTAAAVAFSNDLMQLATNLPTVTDDFTIIAVAAADPATNGPHFITGNYGVGAGNTSGMEFGIYQAKIFTFTTGIAQGSTVLANGAWHRLEADRGTGGGAVIELRVDGVSEGTFANAIPISSPQNWAVGNGTNYGGESFEGLIAEVIVYDRQLTPAELNEVDAYLDLKYFTVPEPAMGLLLVGALPVMVRRTRR